MSRILFYLTWLCLLLSRIAGDSSAAETVLPQADARAAIMSRHFPDRVHEFVWRNWNVVEPTTNGGEAAARQAGGRLIGAVGVAANVRLPRASRGHLQRMGALARSQGTCATGVPAPMSTGL
jgi:hypothetical protein